MNLQILLINGPPRCGKDTLGSAVVDAVNLRRATGQPSLPEARRFKFATALKETAHRAYLACPPGEGEDAFESRKDVPCPEFFGRTPREVYIAVSERLMKPLHGPRVLGDMLAESIDLYRERANAADMLAVVTDSGFREEAEVLVDRYGAPAVRQVLLWRPGCTFAGDSRSYVDLDLPRTQVLALRNEGPIESIPSLTAQVLAWMGLV